MRELSGRSLPSDMGGYLALVAPGVPAEQMLAAARSAAATMGFLILETTPGIVMLGESNSRVVTLVDGSIVAGRLFGKKPGACADGLAFDELLENAWGDYVSFQSSEVGNAIRVVRSPSGGLAAMTFTKAPFTFIASDIELLVALGAPADIDWTFVGHHLAFVHLRAALTGLRSVTEIVPGEEWRISAARTERFPRWSPWRFAEPKRRCGEMEEAAASLREAVEAATINLTAGHRNLLLELSGGLDSSIVASALATARTNASALNLTTPDPEGDERRYARLVGAKTGIAVEERGVSGSVDLTAPVRARTARPGMPAMLGAVEAAFIDTGMRRGIDAYASGTGGDSVFCALSSSAPAADVWRHGGLSLPFARAAREIAEIHNANPWRVAAQAVRLSRRGPPSSAWPRTTTFLHADHLPREPLSHPWLVEPEGALPGTRLHIRSILAALSHLDGYARHRVAPSLFPLLSQPVIETALRIPTWLWIAGGRDRAVARYAFRDLLPPEIVRRRTKGAMDALCARIFQENRLRLRGFLLEGWLARHDLVDKTAVAAYLDTPGPLRDTTFYRLLPIADTERWVRGWLGTP